MPVRRATWILAALLPALAAAQPLETAVAEHRELPREIRLDGTVEAVRQATVSACQVDFVRLPPWVRTGQTAPLLRRGRDEEFRLIYPHLEIQLNIPSGYTRRPP